MTALLEIRPVDLGPCGGYFYERDGAERAAIVLPGKVGRADGVLANLRRVADGVDAFVAALG